MKAKAEAKIRLTLTGAEINMIESLISNNLEPHRRNGVGWVTLRGKLRNKQLKNQ
jgi:hypothetical protein